MHRVSPEFRVINFPCPPLLAGVPAAALLLGACGAPVPISELGAPAVAAGGVVASEADPFASFEDQTGIAPYEFGTCRDDRDCAPSGCGGGICAPVGERGACFDDPVAACLGEVDADLCGCFEGSCRWVRETTVMLCATHAREQAGTRTFRGTREGQGYPVSPAW